MKEIIAYEMLYNKALKYQNDIICVPFQKEYWNEYMKIYNECFYEMRRALEVEPINFYYDYSQIKDKIKDVFLYLQNGAIIGAVSCYENELDDLIVEKSFQGQGIGQKLLFWGINHIKEQGYEEIILHVAEWNQNAVKLYLKNGFSTQRVYRESRCP
jgi:ribosomal protein S18 acetylase RimI-like enzyme